MIYIFIMVQGYTYMSTFIQLYTLNMYSLLYVNDMSIKLCKKQSEILLNIF